jgi:hypothetical protein
VIGIPPWGLHVIARPLCRARDHAITPSRRPAVALQVNATQGGPCSGQERLRGVHGPAEMLGHLGDGQPVQVTQREGASLVGGQPGKGGVCRLGLQPVIPRIVQAVAGQLGHGQAALLPGEPPPVIDELVACHPDEPGDTDVSYVAPSGRRHGRHEGFCGQVFSQRGAAAPRQEIAIDLRQCPVIDRHHLIGAACLSIRLHITPSLGKPRFRALPGNFLRVP